MGSESEKRVPIIDLSKEIAEGSKEWNDLCKRVREACEEFGCFEVIYDRISSQLKEETFSSMKPLFELPLEIKQKNTNAKRYLTYLPQSPAGPFLEGFGVEYDSNFDSIKAFSQTLLSDPTAQHNFCQSVSCMGKHQNELHDTIWSLILDSFGIEETEESALSKKYVIRMMKYESPRADDGTNNLGLRAHSDGSLFTLLCEYQCSGLEIQIKDTDEWIQWVPNTDSHMFVVGDPLVTWSNGRLHAVKHKVILRENKDRYSIGNFVFPEDEFIIKPQKEFIDENHPDKFKPFDYAEYTRTYLSSL